MAEIFTWTIWLVDRFARVRSHRRVARRRRVRRATRLRLAKMPRRRSSCVTRHQPQAGQSSMTGSMERPSAPWDWRRRSFSAFGTL